MQHTKLYWQAGGGGSIPPTNWDGVMVAHQHIKNDNPFLFGEIMRIFEIITDYLLDSPLFEMAFERKTVVNKVRDISITLSRHLIKYLAFDDQAKNHWLNEINGYLNMIDDVTLKPNNKKLSGDVYYSLLWDGPLNDGIDSITRKIRSMTRNEYKDCKRSQLSDAQIYETLEKVLHKLSYDMANNIFTGDFSDYI